MDDSSKKKKILVLVEGEKADVFVIKKLFEVYRELDAKYQIVSYRTNIYALYQEFFKDDEAQDDFDLLQVLKSKETNPEKKHLFDVKYTDILLVFDLDPHDSQFSEEKILRMQEYFCESSDMGKLYINYPMIEAFFHMPIIPDPEYQNRTVSLEELRQSRYKVRVNRESYKNDYRKFISSRIDANYVILENAKKASIIAGIDEFTKEWVEIDLTKVLNKQLQHLTDGYLKVLCTCVMYIYDYNNELLFQG